jgi:hypothetical protein
MWQKFQMALRQRARSSKRSLGATDAVPYSMYPHPIAARADCPTGRSDAAHIRHITLNFNAGLATAVRIHSPHIGIGVGIGLLHWVAIVSRAGRLPEAGAVDVHSIRLPAASGDHEGYFSGSPSLGSLVGVAITREASTSMR